MHNSVPEGSTQAMDYPNILVLAGHEPSGGAGLQADIEAIAAQRGHAATVPTLLVCHDTTNLYDVMPVNDHFFEACIDRLVADITFSAIKIGVVANPTQVRIIRKIVEQLSPIPLVVDPVLNAADGGSLAEDPVGQALFDELFSLATVITPNAAEARQLCNGEADLDYCGRQLSHDAKYALITGGDEPGDEVVNTLYSHNQPVQRWRWPRKPGRYLGSGCTMASTLAARLAHGDEPIVAIEKAQRVTWTAIEHSLKIGRGQAIPNRLCIRADD